MGPSALLLFLGVLVAIPVAVLLVIYVLVPIFKGIGWLIRQIFNFVAGEVADLLRVIGCTITALVFIPLVVINIIIGRWSAASHFGRAVSSELHNAGAAIYRIFIGHPARLLCLTALTEGIEKRLPEVIAAAPGRDTPSGGRANQFEGYEIVGSLAGGGSGGKLYVARPSAVKHASLERSGHGEVDLVVIKAFSLRDGSSLPQIVRESRALDAAKKMGLVLEHELTEERFHYVMRYVPGDSLSIVTQRLHAESGAHGLGKRQLSQALGYAIDLVRTLDGYHQGGLWHKDVKPDNIIIDGKRAHLVDLGLITPLRSALTLTTHGTEYFRDPELVRLALRGVKVHQVDGAKFDIYAAGAVLFSIIENSFPAHGGLSQIEKSCPEALKWVIRRSMTEYDKRYPTAAVMLEDLEAIATADNPEKLRPADLPSMGGAAAEAADSHDASPAKPHAGFEAVWARIVALAGREFELKGGKKMTYVVHGDAVIPDRTDYLLSKSNFRTAYDIWPVEGPGAFGDSVRGQSYVWAILRDSRVWSDAPAFDGVAGNAAAAFPQDPEPVAASVRRSPAPRRRPKLRVTDWWTGKYEVEEHPAGPAAAASPFPGAPFPTPNPAPFGGYKRSRQVRQPRAVHMASPAKVAAMRGHPLGLTAKEQVDRARQRADAARARARERMASRRGGGRNAPAPSNMNFGVAVAVVAFLALGALLVAPLFLAAKGSYEAETVRKRAEAKAEAIAPSVSSPASGIDPAMIAMQRLHEQMLGKRILIIKDGEFSEPGTDLVRSAVRHLSEMDVQLDGDFVTEPGAVFGDDLQNTIAEAQAVRELAPVDSADTTAALARWLEESDAADVLLWVTKSPDDPQTPAFHAVARARDAQAAVAAAMLQVVTSMAVDAQRAEAY